MEDIQCEECHLWSPEANWEHTEVYCELCDTHEALRCPECGAVFDEIYQALNRRGL